MSMSNFLEEVIIDAVLMGQAWGIATNPTLTIALFQGDPGEGSPLNEVSGNGYARQSIAFTKSTTGGLVKAVNTADIEFPVATGPWGADVTHFAIFADTDMVYAGELTPVQNINTNGQLVITAGTLEIIHD